MAKVTVTIPKLSFSYERIVAAGIRAGNTTLDSIAKDFDETTATFDHKPKWVRRAMKLEGDGVIRGSHRTPDENYIRLNNGTDDHIVGRNRQLMSFWPQYRRKTHPGRLQSIAGGPITSGNRVVARGPWMVRGIEPRNFDELVRSFNQPVLVRNVIREIMRLK